MNDRILLVDDEPYILDAYQRCFRGQFQVVTATGVEQAMLALRTMRFSAVMTDFRMPGKNGLSVLEIVRELQPDAVCLVISAYTDILEMTDLLAELGVSQVLLKPCGRDTMIAALTTAVERYREATANFDSGLSFR